jgi:hypothetical protein
MDAQRLEEEIRRMRDGDDHRKTEYAPAKIDKAPGHGQLHARDELTRLATFMTPVAQRDRPEWDGVHGRMIILLPVQNRFTINDREFRLPSLPPERPEAERIDADLFTKIKIGILRDTTEAKRMKDGRRIVRAGNYAFLRLCPTSIKKAYDLTDSLGSVVAVRDVMFLEEFATHQQRQNRAVQAIRTLRAETENIMDTNRRRMETWTRQRKEWEIRLVHHVWDQNLGVFPPYVTAREQLGDTQMEIPHEWVQKPYYQSNHYCGCCLEPMPLICNVCRDDIDNQQEEARERIAREEADAAAEAILQEQNADNNLANENDEIEAPNDSDEDVTESEPSSEDPEDPVQPDRPENEQHDGNEDIERQGPPLPFEQHDDIQAQLRLEDNPWEDLQVQRHQEEIVPGSPPPRPNGRRVIDEVEDMMDLVD